MRRAPLRASSLTSRSATKTLDGVTCCAPRLHPVRGPARDSRRWAQTLPESGDAHSHAPDPRRRPATRRATATRPTPARYERRDSHAADLWPLPPWSAGPGTAITRSPMRFASLAGRIHAVGGARPRSGDTERRVGRGALEDPGLWGPARFGCVASCGVD